MIQILHDLKDPELWELWYSPYYGQCRNYKSSTVGLRPLPLAPLYGIKAAVTGSAAIGTPASGIPQALF